jgi:Tfp pilus assembly protein PilO
MSFTSEELLSGVKRLFAKIRGESPAPPPVASAPGQVLVQNPEDGVAPVQFTTLRKHRKYIELVVQDPLIRGYFEIMATIFLVVFFLIFAIRPTFDTIAQLVKKTDELKEVDTNLGKKIKDLILAQSVYSRLEEKLPLLDRAMPSKPTVDTLITDLETVVRNSNVELTTFTITKIGLTSDLWGKEADYKKGTKIPVKFSFSVKGNFFNGDKVLAGLSNLERLVDLDSVTFSSGKQDVGGDLLITVSGKAYFLP